jgi:hypothetical protein
MPGGMGQDSLDVLRGEDMSEMVTIPVTLPEGPGRIDLVRGSMYIRKSLALEIAALMVGGLEIRLHGTVRMVDGVATLESAWFCGAPISGSDVLTE